MSEATSVTGSARALSAYVTGIQSENLQLIKQALVALAKEIDGKQRLVREALWQYQTSLAIDPNEEDFYDLVGFVDKFTANFDEHRIDLTVISDSKLSAWQGRTDAPRHPVRRHVMLLMIESAIERGVLSGVGYVNEWLGLAGSDELSGSWLLDEKGAVVPKLPNGHRLAVPLTAELNTLEEWQTLSTRTQNALLNDDVVYLGDVIDRPRRQVGLRPHFGRKTMCELDVFLARVGHKFWNDESDQPAGVAEFIEWRNKQVSPVS